MALPNRGIKKPSDDTSWHPDHAGALLYEAKPHLSAQLDLLASLGRLPLDACSEHATTVETVDNLLRFFGADHDRLNG
jgi:hypothetical protein